MMEPFGQAATAAMAMQEGAFGAVVCNSAGSVDKGAFAQPLTVSSACNPRCPGC